MTQANIIDGRVLAKNILSNLEEKIKKLGNKRAPGLATILVGQDKASHLYVLSKRKQALAIGIKSFHHQLDDVSEQELLDLIKKLNHDPSVDGILVQLPLPKHINESHIIDALDPKKDVDGFHPLNLGYLLRGDPKIVACTPLGIMHIIESAHFSLSGKQAVIVGASNIVGKPMAHLLLEADATVTICHKKTKDLGLMTRMADLLIVAAGKAHLINKNHIKKGVFIVDVGINRDQNNNICGDVDFADVVDHVSHITPVPGGVGPLTVAMLLKNTLDIYLRTGR